MKIQKGLVKYKDRSDIICTYGITDDGRQFYFLNDSKLSNNNIIVTSTLVEAIDSSVVHSNVGVIDAEGNVVIPCENKNIKLVTKDILLVERANPSTPSVIEAVNTRKDPLAATKLVSTTAVVKDKIFALMGTDGRFLFNDQFSEASLFDLNGKNLINDQYYSFIAINKASDTIFLCENTAEADVDKFSLTTMTLNDNTNVESAEVPENAGFANIDVNDVNVNKDEIDNAMKDETQPMPEEPPVNQDVVAQPDIPEDQPPLEPTDVIEPPVADTPPVEDAPPVAPEVAQENVEVAPQAPDQEVTEVPAPEVPEAEAPVPEAEVPVPEAPAVPEVPTAPEVPPVEEAPAAPIENPVEVPTPYEGIAKEEPAPEETAVVPEIPSPYEVAPETEEVPQEETNAEELIPPVPEEAEPVGEEQAVEKIEDNNLLDEVNFEHKFDHRESNDSVEDLFKDIDNYNREEKFRVPKENDDMLDDFLNGHSKRDNVRNLNVRDNNYDNKFSYQSSRSGNSNSIMNNAVDTIGRLIEANKNQLNEIDEYRNQVKELTDLNRRVVDRAKEERDKIKASIQNYEDEIDRLKSEMGSLEDRVRDRERIINNQSEELSDLRSQVEGSNNLAKILEDAQSILGNDRY